MLILSIHHLRNIKYADLIPHYQGKYGEIPLEETLTTLEADVPNDVQAKMLADGMEIFVGVLGNVSVGEAKH